MSVSPWFAQPDRPLGTAVLLLGRSGGVSSPLLHWPATLLTQAGWSVLGVTWDEERVDGAEAASEVERCAAGVLAEADPDRPVLVVAKSLGTLALPWAVERGLPGVWLTPLLREPAVVAAVGSARPSTLLVGGSGDPHWRRLPLLGPGIETLELPDADHGLQRPGDWRTSLLNQVPVFERISQFGAQVLRDRAATRASRHGAAGPDPDRVEGGGA